MSGVRRERKFFSTSARAMSVPFTTAQTPGPGAASRRHDAATAQTSSAASIKSRGFNRHSFGGESSGSFLNAARTNASRANPYVLAHAMHYGFHAPKIRVPATTADVVGVADHVPIRRLLATDFTCQCHVRCCSQSDKSRFLRNFDAIKETHEREAICQPGCGTA